MKYDSRVKVFIAASLVLLGVCVLRLVQMQLLADSSLQDEIAALKLQWGQSKQLQTLRGKILDRNGQDLAVDIPRFEICIDYRLAAFWDDRVVETTLRLARQKTENPSLFDLHNEIDTKRADLTQIIANCAKFGVSAEYVESQIQSLNDRIWNLRTFLAWYRSGPDPNLVAKYGGRINSIQQSEALADFERRFPDPAERYKQILAVDDIFEMTESQPLLELKTDDDIFAAQVEFMDVNEVQIQPRAYRHYPYGSTAAQTIGWVGLATQDYQKRLFEHDRLASYLQGEICGMRPGVEYACESILRGRRGERVYDIDRQLVSRTDTDYGDDVTLTLDIDLQQRLEDDLTDRQLNDYFKAPIAAVVIQIRSGDILAMVSLPSYDLNRVRYNYSDLSNEPARPLINRAINGLYPPGSVVKPLVLVAGLETGVITADEVIACPARPAPSGWPNCWIYKQHGGGHDTNWDNYARNAIKGSCNIYFSRLADRIEPRVLQQWLFKFGYGHEVPLVCPGPTPSDTPRRALTQASGQIGSTNVPATAQIETLEQVPALRPAERKMFGIGHGNLRVTPLQVANSFATLARGGLHKPPRLFLRPKAPLADTPDELIDLQISSTTLQVVYDGLAAVVNELHGSGNDAFGPSGLARQGVRVYGKTGSTEAPECAWFAGFAEDNEGAKIAFAVVVEGAQSGAREAAPLAREIIQRCVNAGYVGQPTATMDLNAARPETTRP